MKLLPPFGSTPTNDVPFVLSTPSLEEEKVVPAPELDPDDGKGGEETDEESTEEEENGKGDGPPTPPQPR